ncbi:hypothetical protein F5B21DRAFT_153921 [Xylaria acuta]|nr:hypothetical protein F5B21DRAFT_153921 [Xylaria acuta]
MLSKYHHSPVRLRRGHPVRVMTQCRMAIYNYAKRRMYCLLLILLASGSSSISHGYKLTCISQSTVHRLDNERLFAKTRESEQSKQCHESGISQWLSAKSQPHRTWTICGYYLVLSRPQPTANCRQFPHLIRSNQLLHQGSLTRGDVEKE